MKRRSHILRPSVARSIAVLCAAAFVASAHTAHAGINVWTSLGPPGGNVRALAVDPITTSTLYAAAGGVFKSTDGGATWSAASAGLTITLVIALAIDPLKPGTLYAGTIYDLLDNEGSVFKSTDAGATWSAVNVGLPAAVSTLAINPIAPRTIYAGIESGGGVFKSTDAGATWDATGLTTGGSTLAIDPLTPTTLYARGGGVFKSTDAGATWDAANTGLPDTGVSALAIDPSTPSTLYAGIGYCSPTEGSCFGSVFTSTDAGATWRAANAGLTGTDFSALAIDPITPQTLYAGTRDGGVFKSTDGGSTWSAFNTGLTNTFVDALAIDPLEPRRVYAGTFGGGVFAIEQVQPSCVGDCAGADTVAINDLVTLVNIALGTAQPSACPSGGLPLGAEVDVAVIIQAVTNALNGCGVGT